MTKNSTITPMANKEVQIQFRVTEEYRDDLKRLVEESRFPDMSTAIKHALNILFPTLLVQERKRMLAEFDEKNRQALQRIVGRDDN